MIITYYGAHCIKVQSGETTLVFDPPSKESAFKTPRFQANVVFVSQDHKDRNGFESVGSKESAGAPFLISGPGEYEIFGLSAQGVRINNLKTAYALKFENFNLCYLGDLKGEKIDLEAQEFFNDIDILFLAANSDAAGFVNQIGPKIVIPTHTDRKELESFLKEIGQKPTEPLEKITLKRKDIGDKKREVVVLSAQLN